MLETLALLVTVLPTYYNDGSGSIGVGGTVGLRQGTHPTIRMVEEEIRVKLPERTVRVTFRFKNEGAATRVTMAFPENGYLGGGATKKDLKKTLQSNFGYFRTSVDGKPFRPRLLKGSPNSDGLGYDHWWVKEVPFAKGQTRTVVNEYQGGTTWGPPWSHSTGFTYVLRTGASWKGAKIGRSRVIVDVRDLKNNGPLHLAPQDHWKNANGIYTWERTNFKPEEDISVDWVNNGFLDITINGQSLADQWMEGKFTNHKPPVRSGHEVFVTPKLAATLLPTQKPASGPRVNLVKKVLALGGKAVWKGEKLEITLPKK